MENNDINVKQPEKRIKLSSQSSSSGETQDNRFEQVVQVEVHQADISHSSSSGEIQTKRQQARERMKRYRERQKDKTNENFDEIMQLPSSSVENTQSSQPTQNNDSTKRQLSRERNRRYRERKKDDPAYKAKNAEKCKKYRDSVSASQKVEHSQRSRDNVKQYPNLYKKDNSKERVRAFRSRQILEASENDNNEEDNHQEINLNDQISNVQHEEILPYSNYNLHKTAHKEFDKKFNENKFGFSCSVCKRLWFQSDLSDAKPVHTDTLKSMNFNSITNVKLCSTCKNSLNNQKIPILSVFNGFTYPNIPDNLPKLDFLAERLVAPRIPFMQIRRLRHVHGQYAIYGQIINVPVSVNTMVNRLPRQVDDDHTIYVHIKRQKIHKSSFVHGLVNKRKLKLWLQYLITTPLYLLYKITIDSTFLTINSDDEMQEINNTSQDAIDEISEDIPIEESLTAQQQTLLWNDDKYLRIAPAEHNVPRSLLFDEHAEELSFPSIYCGQFRIFKDGLTVTPFMMATSELRREDRRGCTPMHLLYVAAKIMRLRVRDSLTVAFKHIGANTRITREQIESEEIHNCIETNLAFLRSIPNSVWYWADRKRDLFALIRQKGKLTAFMTLSANEIGWTKLLQLLHKLANKGDASEQQAKALSFMEKSTLINEDAVTCAIYFNKIVNVIMSTLQSKKFSLFGKYRVLHYFKRIEFQHRGSPHAHILLWLDNAPTDILGKDMEAAIEMIDYLISVSELEASGFIKLQFHKHTFTCYKKCKPNAVQMCRFDAPFMPSRFTLILIPMDKSHPQFNEYAERYAEIKTKLEYTNYTNIDDFYSKNGISSDDDYKKILSAGINRPRIFVKREPSQKWNNAFNSFVLSLLGSNMDFQIITEEYSCAAYVVEYVNKTYRGISNLQQRIIEVMNENPTFDIVEITRKMSVDILNSVEMSSQEAAWYLLREPMSFCSIKVDYINTVLPDERQRIKKTAQELSALDIDSTDIWKDDCFAKYEKRPEHLEDVTLAQFVSKYTKNNKGEWLERTEPRVIRYRNYDMDKEFNQYKREMVTLHIPFRNEETDILTEMKFIQIYDQNEKLTLERRLEFESSLDIAKTIEICRQLCRDVGDEFDDVPNIAGMIPEPNPFQQLYDNPNSDVNIDLRLATLNKLGPIAKKKENLMDLNHFYRLMRSSNEKQKELLLHIVHHILKPDDAPLHLFFTGPAGCGKTFVIKLIMEIYNRFSDNDGHFNAFITCASTGKAAVAIDGVTVHTALKITQGRLLPLSNEVAQQYRTLFKYVKVLIIDEVSMIGAELLSQVDMRLKQITGNFDKTFGGLDVILIGDLRQLPPVKATPIYKAPRQRTMQPIIWRDLKFYELTQVMRQANQTFAELLTKIGNGSIINEEELALIQSRFFSKGEVDTLCPHGIRLFYDNRSVDEYNNRILQQSPDKIISEAEDSIHGTSNVEQQNHMRQKFHQMKVIDTGGLPYCITFVLHKPYIITTNIDVADGLANGAVGTIVHLEQNEQLKVTRVWMVFAGSPKTGQKARKKGASYAAKFNIDSRAVPIERRSCSVSMNNNKSITAKRNHFPLIAGCAMTIHKAQGGTFSEVVYQYNKNHPLPLLYVALSRVQTFEKLFIFTLNDDLQFYHCRKEDLSVVSLRQEFDRLSLNRVTTIGSMMKEFITANKGLSLVTTNIQSLRCHVEDIIDSIIPKCNLLLLTETWLDNNDHVDVPNFDCITKYKREHCRSAGVAIYKNNDVSNVITSHMEIAIRNASEIDVGQTNVGDICAALCTLNDGREIVTIVVYISPNQSVSKIIEFLSKRLSNYNPVVAREMGHNLHEMPIILSGDFNINFATDQAQPVVQFLNDKFQLKMNNDPLQATTKSGTTIDAVFSRYLNKLHSVTYITYFSNHKPIISCLESDQQLTITEINDDEEN